MSETAMKPGGTAGAGGAATPAAPTKRIEMGTPATSQVKYEAIDAIREGRAFSPAVHPAIAQEPSVVEVRDFSLYYGDAKALHGISMHIPKGKVTALRFTNSRVYPLDFRRVDGR